MHWIGATWFAVVAALALCSSGHATQPNLSPVQVVSHDGTCTLTVISPPPRTVSVDGSQGVAVNVRAECRGSGGRCPGSRPEGHACVSAHPFVDKLCAPVAFGGATGVQGGVPVWQNTLKAGFALRSGYFRFDVCVHMDPACHDTGQPVSNTSWTAIDARRPVYANSAPRCGSFTHRVLLSDAASEGMATALNVSVVGSRQELLQELATVPPGAVVVFDTDDLARHQLVSQLVSQFGPTTDVHVFNWPRNPAARGGSPPAPAYTFSPNSVTVHRHQDWDYHSFARFSRTHAVAAAVLAFKFGAEDVAGRQAHLRTQLLDPLLCSMVPGGRLVLGSLLNTQQAAHGITAWWGLAAMEHAVVAEFGSLFGREVIVEIKEKALYCDAWRPHTRLPPQHAGTAAVTVIRRVGSALGCDRHYHSGGGAGSAWDVFAASASDIAAEVAHTAARAVCVAVADAGLHAASPRSHAFQRALQRVAVAAASIIVTQGDHTTTTVLPKPHAVAVVEMALRFAPADERLLVAAAHLREDTGDYLRAAGWWSQLARVAHPFPPTRGLDRDSEPSHRPSDAAPFARLYALPPRRPQDAPVSPDKLVHDHAQLRALCRAHRPVVGADLTTVAPLEALSAASLALATASRQWVERHNEAAVPLQQLARLDGQAWAVVAPYFRQLLWHDAHTAVSARPPMLSDVRSSRRADGVVTFTHVCAKSVWADMAEELSRATVWHHSRPFNGSAGERAQGVAAVTASPIDGVVSASLLQTLAHIAATTGRPMRPGSVRVAKVFATGGVNRTTGPLGCHFQWHGAWVRARVSAQATSPVEIGLHGAAANGPAFGTADARWMRLGEPAGMVVFDSVAVLAIPIPAWLRDGQGPGQPLFAVASAAIEL